MDYGKLESSVPLKISVPLGKITCPRIAVNSQWTLMHVHCANG